MKHALSELFLEYVNVHTTSAEESGATPSTACQFNLSRILEKQLRDFGASDVFLADRGNVYARIPATPGYESKTGIGFIAHIDTSEAIPDSPMHPQIIENYDGGDVALGSSGLILSPRDFPDLRTRIGETLITTDGTTLLGADDKAGIAEIMYLAERLLSEDIPHGPVSVAFTTDEEVGRGADGFDFERFGVPFAYTVDGGAEGSVEYENFNAASAKITCHGVSTHPGYAKNLMVNAILTAMEFNSMLPSGDVPQNTEGYEGYYHLMHMEGGVTEAKLGYIIRDFEIESLACRRATMEHAAKLLCEKYGEDACVVEWTDEYRNMKEHIEPAFHLIDRAMEAASRVGLTGKKEPIRGGTDGARLSYEGLPCPNLGTGSFGHHGPHEHTTVESMQRESDLILEIVRMYAEE